MKLEELGNKTEFMVVSQTGVYSPLKLKMDTRDTLDFEGNVDVMQLLTTQIDMLKTRNNKFVSEQLLAWAKVLAGKRGIVTVSQDEHHVTCEQLGRDTCIIGTLYGNGSIQCELYLPVGVVCVSSKPMEEMSRALGVLRRRIADEYDARLAEYKGQVNIRASAIDASLLGLDLDLDIGSPFPAHETETSPKGGVLGDGGEELLPPQS